MLGDILPGWRVRYRADGLALQPPEGPALGGIRVRERVQPLRRARDVIASAREQLRDLRDLAVGPLETFTTCEGEYAAVATIGARRGDARVERTIGLVWGDYHYTQLDGVTEDAASHARFRQGVRDLTYFHALGLGELRRRRYRYAAPPGWHGYPRGLITEWYAPGFPDEHGFVSVFPARADERTAAGQLDRLLHEMSWFGFTQEALDGPEAITTASGLAGHAWRPVGRFGDGPRRFLEVVVLYDRRFAYVLRLETDQGENSRHHAVFRDLVRSVVELPTPAPSGGGAFGEWIT